MEWLPTWEQLASILGLVIGLSVIVGFFMKIGEKRRAENRIFRDGMLSMQNNISKIMESIAKIEGKMDTSASQIIELERKNAIYEQKIEAAWKAIDKIEKNCSDIQKEKRKEYIS